MTKEKNNMDDFLRGSLNDFEIQPSQSVWKKISRRLLILELIRLNFSNVSKYWLYSGLIALMVIPGTTYFNLNNNTATMNSIATNSVIEEAEDKPAQKNITINDDATETTQTSASKTTPSSATEIVQPSAGNTSTINYQQAEKNSQEPAFEDLALIEERDDAIPNENNIQEPAKKESQAVLAVVSSPDKQTKTEESLNTSTSNLQKTTAPTALAYSSPAASQTKTKNRTTQKNTTELNKLEPKTFEGSGFFSIYIYEDGIINIPPLKISSRTKPYKFDKPKTKKEKQRVSKKNRKNSFKKNKKENKRPNPLIERPTYTISADYQHHWPGNFKEYIPQTNMFSINGGINYKRFEAGIGIGIQGGENNAAIQVNYSSMDSVGYYYDIDYYEIIPDNPDSIIIHYTMVPTFDTVSHTELIEGKQKNRWVVLPIRVAYEVLKKESYILALGLSAQFGWEYYQETPPVSTIQSITEIAYKPIGSAPTNSYITLGIGVENQIKVYKNWWLIVEPKAYYYLKTPYKWDGSGNHGPFGFGLHTGIRFKF